MLRMDLSGSDGSFALELSRAADGVQRPVYAYSIFDCHPDAAPAHMDCFTNANLYTYPFPHPYTRTGWLPEAA